MLSFGFVRLQRRIDDLLDDLGVLRFRRGAEQYRLFKELEFLPIKVSPMLFGTLVHETLEEFHKATLRGEAHRIDKVNVET